MDLIDTLSLEPERIRSNTTLLLVWRFHFRSNYIVIPSFVYLKIQYLLIFNWNVRNILHVYVQPVVNPVLYAIIIPT